MAGKQQPARRGPTGTRRRSTGPPLGKIAATISGVVALVVVAFFLFGSSDDNRTTASRGSQSSGGNAPTIELQDFGGKTFSLAQYEGRPVVVNFWASWCPFCIGEMPGFEKVHQQVKDDVAFVGIDQRETNKDAAVELAKETGVTYRLVEDPQGRMYDAFGGVGMPTTAFVDENGNVLDVISSALTEGQLRDLITENFGISF